MRSIGRLENLIMDIKHNTYYVGQDENDKPIYDKSKPLPTINFIASVKVHGTFAGIRIEDGNIIPMSKENDLSIGKDNAGFAQFIENRKETILEIFKNKNTILYGEFCGGNIQKGVGVNYLNEKHWIIFDGTNVSNKEMNELIKDERIHNIYDFGTYNFTLNFNNLDTTEIDDIRDAIEKECPVAKKLTGKNDCKLIGEGFVARSINTEILYEFKHKGEEHAKQPKKIKKNQKDPCLKCIEFANEATHGWRLEQATKEVNAQTMNETGDFIKWVLNDIIKEEQPLFQKYDITMKEVTPYISRIIVPWYKEYIHRDQ